MKKAKVKGKSTAKKPKAKKSNAKKKARSTGCPKPVVRMRATEAKVEQLKEPEAEAPKDFVEVRKNIASLVRKSAGKIAAKAIEVAMAGQLAPAKYFFEAVGLYPPTAETSGPEESLAYELLMRAALPIEEVDGEDGEVSDGVERGLAKRVGADLSAGSSSGLSSKLSTGRRDTSGERMP